MPADNAIGEFLRARRALVQPADVGLPDTAARRRVPGLRREELSLLAGVSVDYYVRLEQGRERHPSEQVVGALARALDLDEDMTAHLHELARPAPRRRRAAGRRERVQPSMRRLLAQWPHTPAFVVGRHKDVLAHNALAAALSRSYTEGANLLRAVFLDPAARDFHLDWERVARDAVATLRADVGPDLDDPRLTQLVGELSLKSEEFRRLWARHDVREKGRGSKRLRHPVVGELTLDYEWLSLRTAPGQTLVVYHAEPGSRSERSLALLASVAAEGGRSAGERYAAGAAVR